MVNDIFNKSLILSGLSTVFKNVSCSDEVQYLASYAADTVRNMVFIQVWTSLQNGFLESLVNRHDQPGCHQVARDRIGPHLAVDDQLQSITVQ